MQTARKGMVRGGKLRLVTVTEDSTLVVLPLVEFQLSPLVELDSETEDLLEIF